ncbi:MAG: hypothetical protein OEM97_05000 [Acidimicrobiia bacterium]|nr:hypothetical protein [Acidimicrobiia bacterium]
MASGRGLPATTRRRAFPDGRRPCVEEPIDIRGGTQAHQVAVALRLDPLIVGPAAGDHRPEHAARVLYQEGIRYPLEGAAAQLTVHHDHSAAGEPHDLERDRIAAQSDSAQFGYAEAF